MGPKRAPERYEVPLSKGAPMITASAAASSAESRLSARGTPRNVTSGPNIDRIAARSAALSPPGGTSSDCVASFSGNGLSSTGSMAIDGQGP